MKQEPVDDYEAEELNNEPGENEFEIEYLDEESLHDMSTLCKEEYQYEENALKLPLRIRRFQYSWIYKFPWLKYDKIRDRPFCKFCNKILSNNLSNLTRHGFTFQHRNKVLFHKNKPISITKIIKPIDQVKSKISNVVVKEDNHCSNKDKESQISNDTFSLYRQLELLEKESHQMDLKIFLIEKELGLPPSRYTKKLHLNELNIT